MAKKKSAKPQASAIFQPKDEVLVGGEQTLDYRSFPYTQILTSYGNRPWFTLLQMNAMLLDQQVWFGLQLRNAPLIQAKVEVKCRYSHVRDFVQKQWDRLWMRYAPKILATKYYGYAGFEVKYVERNAYIEIDSLKDFAPGDVRAMYQGGEGIMAGKVAGVGIHGQRKSPDGTPSFAPTYLYGMKGLWLNYQATHGSMFGQAATYKAYPAWWDKAMPGGAYDLRRLRGIKDAWVGDMIKYPLKWSVMRPDGTQVTGRDIAKEIVELRQTGAGVVIPSDVEGATGKPLFDYQPPTSVADTGIIKQWIDDADWDIFDGLMVPKEVVEAAASGSGFSGRSIPFVMFLAMGDIELLDYLLAIKQQLLEPLVVRNFGRWANDFDMIPIPLLDVMAAKMGGQQMGGPVGGTGSVNDYHRGSPDGRPAGIASAAGDIQEPSDAVQFSAIHAPHDMTIRGKHYRGGEFVPKEVVALATAAQRAELGGGGQGNPQPQPSPDPSPKPPGGGGALPVAQGGPKPVMPKGQPNLHGQPNPRGDDRTHNKDLLGKLPGGRADSVPESKFDPEELKQGEGVESEHTSDPEIAEEIAKDHLTEDPEYYDKLEVMEAKPSTSDDDSEGTETDDKPVVSAYAKSMSETTRNADGSRSMANGDPLPDFISKLKIPGSWANVRVATDPNSDLLAEGTDVGGRRQVVFAESHAGRRAASGIAKMSELLEKREAMLEKTKKLATSSEQSTREAAQVMWLIEKLGLRAGSDKDKDSIYGARTIQGQHVVKDGEQVRLQFTGKDGVAVSVPVEDAELSQMLLAKKQRTGDSGRIFSISDDDLMEFANELSGGTGNLSPQDFRALTATELAIEEIEAAEPPQGQEEYKSRVMEVAAKVAKSIGTTPVAALQSYIDPAVFSMWREKQ